MIEFFIRPLKQLWVEVTDPSLDVASRRVALVAASAIGLVSGLAAFLLRQGIGWFGGLRIALASQVYPWIALPLFGAVGAGLAGLAITTFARQSRGSGLLFVRLALAPRGLSR